MSLSNPRIIFGIHSVSPYNRATKMPYGILKVIGSANLALSSDTEQLFAGSNKFAWAAEGKTIATELTAKVKAYPGFLFSLFLGASVTDSAVDTAGSTTTLIDGFGGSVVASTGIATVSVLAASKANLKFGKYAIKATSPTAFKIYALSDIDFQRGTDAAYVSDDLEISGPHTVVSATDTDVATLGLRFAGGAGVIAMTVDDTATFEVKPPSQSSSDIIVGSSTTSLPNFGALLNAQKRADGSIFEIDAHNCVGSGLPITMEEQAFSQPELKMTCLYDSSLDRVFTIRSIFPE